MRANQYCNSESFLFQHDLLKLFDRFWIQPHHRFIQKQHFRPDGKRTADTHLLHHSFGQLISQFILLVIQVKPGKQRFHLFIRNPAVVSFSHVFDVFSDAECIKHGRHLRNIGKLSLCLHTSGRKSLNSDPPLIPKQTCDTFDDRRFSGSVWSQKDPDCTIRYKKTDLIHRQRLSIGFT